MTNYDNLVRPYLEFLRRARREYLAKEKEKVRSAVQSLERQMEETRKSIASFRPVGRDQQELLRNNKKNFALACEQGVAFRNDYESKLLGQLTDFLQTSINCPRYPGLNSLKDSTVFKAFDPGPVGTPLPAPAIEHYVPPEPGLLGRLMPGATKRFKTAYADGLARHKAAAKVHAANEQKRLVELQRLRAEHEARVKAQEATLQAQHASVDAFREATIAGEPAAVALYYELMLAVCNYPLAEGHRAVRIAYVPESRQLVVEIELPLFDVVPKIAEYRYLKTKDEIAEVARPPKERRAIYRSLIAQIVLQGLYEVFTAEEKAPVDSVVLNGHVDTIDPATGRPIRPCLVTVRTTRSAFSEIDLRNVEPVACLKALRASLSPSPDELAPVRPVLEFNMVDPRFIKESDVLSTLDQRPNLMALTPGEFEALITNLFSKMGLETRLTQASRDGGVDCVAYDPRPIFGGKVVIQAKRYKNTVGVSAVRDLFGTLQNEGASKGILVTTSGYGKAAFDFAEGKPLELLSGGHLLHLLAEHAGMEAKIIMPDDWKDPEPDSDRGDV